MLVTGSKHRNSDTTKGLSIRLRQGGQSFYESLPTDAPQGKSVRVVVEGVDCTTFPKSVAESVDLREMLTNVGVDVEGAEIATWSNDGPVCYAFAVPMEDAEAVRVWAAQMGVEAEFCTPLTASVRRAVIGSRHSKTLALQFGREELYVALSVDGKLTYAECVGVKDDEQLLNFLAVLNGDFDLRKADIFVSGVEGKRRTKLLGRYFRRCKWESEWADVYNI